MRALAQIPLLCLAIVLCVLNMRSKMRAPGNIVHRLEHGRRLRSHIIVLYDRMTMSHVRGIPRVDRSLVERVNLERQLHGAAGTASAVARVVLCL